MNKEKLEVGNSSTIGLILVFMFGLPVLVLVSASNIADAEFSTLQLNLIGGIAVVVSFTIGIIKIIRQEKFVFFGINERGIVYKNEPYLEWYQIDDIKLESDWIWKYRRPHELRHLIFTLKNREQIALNITKADIAGPELLEEVKRFQERYGNKYEAETALFQSSI
jgi:hypothetical protein